jgi:hypothetical protein
VPTEFLADGPGSRLIRARIKDKDGDYTDYETLIPIENAPPTVAIMGAPSLALAGAAIHLGAAIADPGTADTHTVAWTVSKDGDLFTTGSGVNFSFTPTGHGTYEVSVVTTDDDGAAASDSRRIVVHAVGAGNVTVSVKNGKTSIEGDQQHNALVIEAGNARPGSLRIVGLGGTRVNGQTAPVEIANPGTRIDVDLKAGNDWLFFDGRAGLLNIAAEIDVETSQGEDHVRFEQVLVEGDAAIDTGVQANDVRLSDATFLGVLMVDARSGADRIKAERVTVAGKATFDGGVGRNEIRIADSAFAQGLLVRGQSGADSVQLERLAIGGPAAIEAGVGDNEVFVIDSSFGGELTVDAGSGADLLRISCVTSGESCASA